MPSPNQIEERKQEDPHDVDEMPVQATEVYWREILAVESSVNRTDEQPGNHDHACYHVHSVQAGHAKVDPKEDLHVAQLRLRADEFFAEVRCLRQTARADGR